MVRSGTERVRRLRERAERALDRQRPDHELMRLLDELVDAAPRQSEDSLFAHRQLAELRLERHPWRAALHLKAILDQAKDDEGANALMGLCHALLGNYRAAAQAYRRALRISPTNPWYHHNLGHLLDVGIGDHRGALHHLRKAYELEPDEDEIAASLARCLAVLGRFEQAIALVAQAVERAPQNEDHRALRGWIERRARGEESDEGTPAACGEAADTERSSTKRGRSLDEALTEVAEAAPEVRGGCAVRRTLETRMLEAGFSSCAVRQAYALWTDFQGRRKLRGGKPEVIAAAVEYALAKIQQRPNVTQAEVAKRYGVAAGSVSIRYGEIRDALSLRPGDPRYGEQQS